MMNIYQIKDQLGRIVQEQEEVKMEAEYLFKYIEWPENRESDQSLIKELHNISNKIMALQIKLNNLLKELKNV